MVKSMKIINTLVLFTVVSSYCYGTEVSFTRSSEQIQNDCQSAVIELNHEINTMINSESVANYKNVYQVFDIILTKFTNSVIFDSLMQNVHPDESVRKSSADCALKGMSAFNGLVMNRELYQKLIKVETKGLSEQQRFNVNYWKTQFELSGIGENETTRQNVKELNDKINELSEVFSQNITDDVRSISIKADRLSGLPQDYIDSHPPGVDGLIKVTTSYSDISPIFKYAHDENLRSDVMDMFTNRAYPQNTKVLKDLLTQRHKLATMLGRESFADLVLLDTMAENTDNVGNFVTSLSEAINTPVFIEKKRLLERYKKINPIASQIKDSDSSYVANLIRQEDYALNAKVVREYFDYDNVRDGLIELAEDLFTLNIRINKQKSWHSSVESFDVFEDDKLIGRFFFDSHPREGKYTHAAQFGIRLGRKDDHIPQAALVMNFPKGLMEHGQVETFLHEFGHLLHYIFAGQNSQGMSRFQSESDFGEAPSIMLEEWVWDYDTLSKFAKNSEGGVIPKELVSIMNNARYFGQGISTATQLEYTAFSLLLYSQDPIGMNLNTFQEDISNQYSPFGYRANSHFYTSFGHLTSYSAKYYTYQWSNAIAEELLSRFKKEGLRNKKTAQEYREKILSVTGTRKAANLVKDFLGRDYTIEAYAERLSNAN